MMIARRAVKSVGESTSSLSGVDTMNRTLMASPRGKINRRVPWLFLLWMTTGLSNLLLFSYNTQVWWYRQQQRQGGRLNSSTKRNPHNPWPPTTVIEVDDLSQYPPLASWSHPHTQTNENGQITPDESTTGSSTTSRTSHGGSSASVQDLPPFNKISNVSFCLIIKDDNQILNEWIAYHYHLWNLRHLIVAVDPSSLTSPREMLDVWKKEFGLDVVIWEDARYLPTFFLEGQYELVPRMIKMEDKNATKWKDTHDQSSEVLQQKYVEINNHRYRQSKFLQHCSKAIQGTTSSTSTTSTNVVESSVFDAKASRWMTHIDTDEYIALNPTLLLRLQTPQDQNDPQYVLSTPVPTKLSSGSLLDFLERAIRIDSKRINWPCISMPRVLYSSVEDDNVNITTITASNPSGWNRKRFETLRWKYHADFGNRQVNKQPKVIMDVAGFPPFNVSRKAFSIHRPSQHLCRMQAQMDVHDASRYPLVVHHYLGSWDRYQARQDPRRTLLLYNQNANMRDDKDKQDGVDGFWIDGWLTEFVAHHGPEKVSKVLWQYQSKNSGEISSKQSTKLTIPVQAPEMGVNTDNIIPRGAPLELGKKLSLQDDSLSACLLIKDDNDILNEWIAYHHHILKLRTLIVAVDPSSLTSPIPLLERWRSLMDGIQVWNDADYMPDFFLQGNYDLVPNLMGNNTNSTTSTSINHQDGSPTASEREIQQGLVKINNHRFRQVTFLSTCIQSLLQQNKTWMMHIDSDEYVTLHPKVRTQDSWRHLPLDPKIRSSSLFELLKTVTREYSKGMSYPCVSMPRLLYGSKEDADDPSRFSKLPTMFEGTKFESLRWKYHANYDSDVKVNGKPKAILDLSGVPPLAQMLKSKIYSIHRPGLHLCQSDRAIIFDAPHKFPLTVNHYLGSWERYSRRDDLRRSRVIYDSKALVDAGKDDDWIDGWVASFVEEHGLAKTVSLLQGGPSVDEDRGRDTPVNAAAMSKMLVDTADTLVGGNMTDILLQFDPSIRMEFSACLLVKDDNDILNEWIAYHYHVLGLRYVIVAIDAKSRTSPSDLFDRWRQFGMGIEEWTDELFMPDIYFQKAYHLQPRLVKMKKNKGKWLEGIDDPEVKREYFNTIQDHRFRQITFLASCAKKLRDQGRTWMIHIDTDEYITVNPKLRQQKTFGGSIQIPSTAEASIVPRLLNEMIVKRWDTLNYPCVSLPRLLYGSIESTGDKSIPVGYNHSRFESLRWKYHAEFDDSALNKQPKVILDVSAIPANDTMFLEERVFSIHRPSQFLCRSQGQMKFEDTEYFPFSVNHYLGTFERFGSRDDPRRNRKLYDQKANIQAVKDDDRWIDSWLPNFIQTHGEENVSQLLRDYRSSNYR